MQETWTDNYMKFRGKTHQWNEKLNKERKLSTDQLDTRAEKYQDYFCCCSVTKSCPTLCNPMDCSTPGLPLLSFTTASFPISWSLLKFMSVELVMPSNHLILCCLLLLLPSIFPSIRVFPVSWLFASDGQNIGASAWVLPMNIQGWFPLGFTGLISLLSKRLSRVFSNTTVQKHQFYGAQLSL